jgi:hypothetical protein
MEVFVVEQSWPFVVALMLLLLVTIVEGLSVLLGASASGWLDSLLPDPWDAVTGPIDSWLGWLHVGRVPALVLVVIFLAAFSFTGLTANVVVNRWFDVWIPVFLSVPIAFVSALPVVRILGAGLARVIPKDESSAVTFDTLLGRVAVMVGGEARKGSPAQGKVNTDSGQTIYLMIEPDNEGATFVGGDKVLLVRQLGGSRFSAITNPRPDIL